MPMRSNTIWTMVVAIGCGSETTIKTIEPEECITEPSTIDCGGDIESSCQQHLIVESEILDCLWDPIAGDWTTLTPSFVSDSCTVGADCDALIGEVELVLVEGCASSCFDACVDSLTCCSWNWPTTEPEWLVGSNNLFAAMSGAGCSSLFPIVPLPTCEDEVVEPAPSWTFYCPQTANFASPDADFDLDVDRNDSYLEIIGPSSSMNESVTGFGALAVGPAAGLGGFFWVDDTTFLGDPFTDWVFTFRNPVDLTMVGSGYYYVTQSELDAAGAIGRGTWDGNPASMGLDASTPGYGHLDAGTGAWTFNLTQTIGSTSITLHLEGSSVAR